jgi:hypothetical protein
VALAAARRTLELARFTLTGIEAGYTAAKVAIGVVNRKGRKDRHDRAINSDRYVARRGSQAFGTMNHCRGAMIRARKVVAAAEIAQLALAA